MRCRKSGLAMIALRMFSKFVDTMIFVVITSIRVGKITAISWMIFNINYSWYEHTKYRRQRKTFSDGNIWNIEWRMLYCKREFFWVPVKTSLWLLRIDTSTHQIIQISRETGYAQNDNWRLWGEYYIFNKVLVQFSGVVMPYKFDCANAWRLMSFASNGSKFLIWDFSDFTNKHVVLVTYVNICDIVTDHCRRICVIMNPVSWSTSFININYGSKNSQQLYRPFQVLFLILLSTSFLFLTVIFVSITSSIIHARIPTSGTVIRISRYPQ